MYSITTKSRFKICPICKKEFMMPLDNNFYRIKRKGKTTDYCSYTCWKKAGGENREDKKYGNRHGNI